MNLIKYILKACLVFQALPFFAQNCDITVDVHVVDSASDIPLAFSTIYIDEIEKGLVTDSSGFAKINNLCSGAFHMEIGHLGCSTQSYFIEITKDTTLRFNLEHHAELLDEIVVHGHQDEGSTIVSSSITFDEISANSYKNISDVLNAVPGVRSLKNGGISKPIIHGLFGNRIALVNNGIVQSGQQWGTDHAPEIDPFSADHIAVVKGAGALEYGTNAIGGVILVDSDVIGDDPHLSGQLNYIYETNGRGHTINGALQKSEDKLNWRWTGTFKRKGDSSAPDYLLKNTGLREINTSLFLEQKWNENNTSRLQYSLFNTDIGVLRGSHIGNLTDLELSINREIPFYTTDTFSYSINAPSQKVSHHLLKIEHDHFINADQSLQFKYGGQLNQRDEFDVRRRGRSDTPALSLNQYQHFGSIVYNLENRDNSIFKSGIQLTFTDNANNPGTGILPLIPRYKQWIPAVFSSYQSQRDKWTYELGMRFEKRLLDVTNITQTVPRELEFLTHDFNNISGTLGIKFEHSEKFNSSFNIIYSSRAPEVNELYSNGLHQGVSGIEQGNRNLNQEKTLKSLFSNNLNIGNKVFIQSVLYYQYIRDFIFLQPNEEFVLTIRGAFPLFTYEQTNARIYGADFQISAEPLPQLKFINSFALVRGTDITMQTPLVYIPSDQYEGELKYSFPNDNILRDKTFTINWQYTFEQNRYNPNLDFLAPPEGYFLLGAKLDATIPFGENNLDVSLIVNNLLNTKYRDYLNRLRYYADEQGRNILLRLNYRFKK